MDDLDVAGENTPSTPTSNSHARITLVLPSLRALKAANAGKKSKAVKDVEYRPKIPRPVKLKPLKEVLTKLIAQIKKKDDYAFFIHPVDPEKVPGYADVIKHPMDFGTMSVKVAKGRYRSLEEFATDLRLVTTNAKTFNPPGSIYHAEADRLEAWGLDHIARASAHVIEYETDWNIDVEQDEDGSTSLPVTVIGEDEASTPRDIEGSLATGSRAPSTTPAPGQSASQLGQGKRGPRGPYRKNAPPTTLSEGLDAEGRMPGAKDGVGAFPAGSDWAELMIALKIKGKRYKTKKERLRFEKEGPPYRPDGSLDYSEMEDPFSVLNVFVPEPPAHPQIIPLYPTSSVIATVPTTTVDGTRPHSQIPDVRMRAPISVTIPSKRPTPILSTLSNIPTPSPTAAASSAASVPAPAPRLPKKRRHWTIVRNVPARLRAKDKDGDTAVADDVKSTWQVPRDAGPADYGTFATLLGELAAAAAVGPASHQASATATTGTAAADYVYGTEHRLFATIRSTVVHRGAKRKEREEGEENEQKYEQDQKDDETFWTDARAVEAWDYLRDVVYGGVDGYAYVRSLAEFVAPPVYLKDVRRDEGDRHWAAGVDPNGHGEGADLKLNTDADTDMDGRTVVTPPRDLESSQGRQGAALTTPFPHVVPALPLGVPLARYVEDNLVDTVTRGRHGWLRDVFLSSSYGNGYGGRHDQDAPNGKMAISPFNARRAVIPEAAREAEVSQKWTGELLDIAALIRAPEELARERALEGCGGGGAERGDIERALKWSVEVIEELARRVAKGVKGENGDEGDMRVKEEEEEEEGMDEAQVIGQHKHMNGQAPASNAEAVVDADTMDVDADVSGELKPESGAHTSLCMDGFPACSVTETGSEDEDPLMERLRLNLLALAKRAPLEKIAGLPVELVPEHIRGIVPIAQGA